MNHFHCKWANVFLLAGLLLLPSCNSEKKAEPDSASSGQGSRTVAVVAGEAGGVVEDTFTASATVSDINKSERKITLKSADGSKTSFTAGPQIRNFDQLKEGDKVNATVTERLEVFVRGSGEDPRVTHSAALARAPKGAKPGALVAEMYEIVAAVKSIDQSARTAALEFSDGQTRTVKVRPDVDLSRYKVGDNVVIRVSAALTVVAETP